MECSGGPVGLNTLGQPEDSASPIQRVELRVLSPVNLNTVLHKNL